MSKEFYGIMAALSILLSSIFVAIILSAALYGCYGDVPHGHGGDITKGVNEIYALGECPLEVDDPGDGEPTPSPTPGDNGGGDPNPTPTPTASPTPTPSTPYSCGEHNEKTLVCHRPVNSHADKWVTICIAEPAITAHLEHGDYLGPCSDF